MIPDDILAASTALSEARQMRSEAQEREARVCLAVVESLGSRDRVRLACRGHEAAPQISAEEVYRRAEDVVAVNSYDVGPEWMWTHRVKAARRFLRQKAREEQ